MKITFLGAGSAFSRRFGNSNLLIESGSMKIAIDCGHTFCSSLPHLGLGLQDITHIFITHLHGDHIGGLEELAIMSKFSYQKRPKLLGTKTLLDRLWNASLRGGLEYIEETPGDEKAKSLEDYFNCVPLNSNSWNELDPNEPLHFFLQPTHHVQGLESYGLRMSESHLQEKNHSLFFSGDTKFDLPLITKEIERNPLFFHDCQLYEQGINNERGVHTSYNQLLSLSPEQRAHMWLYHYGDEEKPDAAKDGFCGFVKPFQSFEF